MADHNPSRPSKRQRLNSFPAAPDGFRSSATKPKSKSSTPIFKSDFHPQSSSSRQSAHTAKVAPLTTVVVPSLPRHGVLEAKQISTLAPRTAKLSHVLDDAFKSNHPCKLALVNPSIPSKKQMSVVESSLPAPQLPSRTNPTPRKPVSQIKFPSLPPTRNESRPAVKKISTTSIAAAIDLGTDSGRTELLSLSMPRHPDIGDHVGPSTSSADYQIACGLEVSPNKSRGGASGFRRNSRKFVRGGLADQACILLSRFQTAETLWSRQLQLSNNTTKPDMRLQVVDIPHPASSCAVLVKCIELPDKRQVWAALLLPNAGLGEDLQMRQNQHVHIWRPWTIVRDVVFCKRFVIVS